MCRLVSPSLGFIKILDIRNFFSSDNNWLTTKNTTVFRADKEGNLRLKYAEYFTFGIVFVPNCRDILSSVVPVAQCSDLLWDNTPIRLLLAKLSSGLVELLGVGFVPSVRQKKLHFRFVSGLVYI